MANALGIDYGRRRMGLSFADELGVAMPLDALPGVEEPRCFETLAEVVRERNPDLLVVGYPLNMDGTVGSRAREVDAFVKELEQRFALPVEKVDERLTTYQAKTDAKATKRRRRKNRGELDSSAAALILRDYLESRQET
ncbi:MAG: Holliday junction resolvase RuvX [Opitutales bacterium]|jgi:putative Holliday junction resolvase|nr:Holliday junction resolvase RuvX [Opitutales bacterium]|tara:strand:- start:667 stop:1083 length:417 start_codon:yes stop_codon:yes gene_type:complete